MSLEAVFFFFLLGAVFVIIGLGAVLVVVQKKSQREMMAAIEDVRNLIHAGGPVDRDEWIDLKQEKPICVRHEFPVVRVMLVPEQRLELKKPNHAAELAKIKRQMEALSK